MIFGPVNSRRFGISLGIDLSPSQKCCNFDCIYCELGAGKRKFSISNAPQVKDIIRELKNALSKFKNIDVITITANGEPTLYPNLKELAKEIKLIKEKEKLLILSNGTGVLRTEICEALMEFDIVKFSLDSAFSKTFKKIDRSGDIYLEEMIEKMANFRLNFKNEFVIEVLVIKGFNDSKKEFEALNKALNRIKPDRVDISTLHRPPAYKIEAVDNEILSELALSIKNIPVCVVNSKKSKEKFEFSKDEILNIISRRPQSQIDIDELFSDRAKALVDELLSENLVKKVDIAGVCFYKI